MSPKTGAAAFNAEPGLPPGSPARHSGTARALPQALRQRARRERAIGKLAHRADADERIGQKNLLCRFQIRQAQRPLLER